MQTDSLPDLSTESARVCVVFVLLAHENDQHGVFHAWILERSDVSDGHQGTKAPLGLERSDCFKGPKSPFGPHWAWCKATLKNMLVLFN